MIQIALYEYYNGPLVYDFTFEAKNPEFQTNEHGYGYFKCEIPMDIQKSTLLYSFKKTGYIRVGNAAKSYYEGRLEDVELTDEGLQLTAYGYIRAFTDLQVTDLWSTTDYQTFEVYGRELNVDYKEEKYLIDTQNHVYFGVKNNNTYGLTGGNEVRAGVYIAIPEDGTRKFACSKFSWSGIWGNSFQAFVIDRTSLTSTGSTPWSESNVNIGSATLFHTGNDKTVFTFAYLRNAANALFLGEDGEYSIRFTNFRAGTTTSISGSILYADEILRYTVSGVYSLNSRMINPDTTYIESPQVDLTDVLFEDITGLDVVKYLLNSPDSNNKYYECKVFDKQLVRFNRKGKYARTWLVDVASVYLSRRLDTVHNQTRVRYTNVISESVDERTSYLTDNNSIDTFGVTRQASIKADTNSSTTANIINAALLADGKDIRSIASISTDRVVDQNGQRVSSIEVRSGDIITLIGIPVKLLSDSTRSFVVGDTTYDMETGIISINPEQITPELEKVLAELLKDK